MKKQEDQDQQKMFQEASPVEGENVVTTDAGESKSDDTVEEEMVIAGRVHVELPKTSAIVLKYRKIPRKKFLQFE